MGKDVNEIRIRGRLARSIEAKQGPSGKSYCFFTVATGGGKKNDAKNPASFHSCVAFAELAEWLHGLAKGAEVEIRGRIQYKEKRVQGEKYPIMEAQIVVEHVDDPDYSQRDDSEDEITDADVPF